MSQKVPHVDKMSPQRAFTAGMCARIYFLFCFPPEYMYIQLLFITKSLAYHLSSDLKETVSGQQIHGWSEIKSTYFFDVLGTFICDIRA